MEREADWKGILVDLLELIIRKLDRFPDDHVRFSAVCKSWRRVALENRCHISPNQFPGLMVPGIHENSLTRSFRRLNHQTGYFEDDSMQLNVPHGCVCRGSAYGWVFMVDDELNTKLLNPFSSAEIQLPSVATLLPPQQGFNTRDKWYVDKVVFSSNPSCTPPPVILIIYEGHRPRLAYCKPGDETWTALECLRNDKYYFMDAIYYKDRFLALDDRGKIMALDIGISSTSSSSSSVEVNVVEYSCVPGMRYYDSMFLVELEEDLVVLVAKQEYTSDSDDDDNDDFEGEDYRNAYSYGDARTVGFIMLSFESNEQIWVKIKSLGDNAIFIGYNTSFSLPRASEHPGCISNSIYFTNGNAGSPATQKYGYDMGIYNLMDKSINPLYQIGSQLFKPSPIWITRLPCYANLNF